MLRGGVLAFSVGRDGGCTLERVAGMEMVGATGGASKARMPEMNAQRLCRTQSQQSVHKEARVMVRGKAMDVLLRKLLGWRGSVQREGQAV